MFNENKVIKCGICGQYVPVTPDFKAKLEQVKGIAEAAGAEAIYRCGKCKRDLEG